MVFVTQNDMGGLGQALQNVGAIGGNVLQDTLSKMGEKRLQAAQAPFLSQALGGDTTLGRLLAIPGGGQLIQQLGPAIAPFLKEEAKQRGVSSFFGSGTDLPSQNASPISSAQSQPQEEIATGEESIQTPQGTFQSEDIVEVPGFGTIPREMISKALRNPNEQIRRWGEGAQKALLEKEKNQRKSFESDRAFHTKATEKAEEEIRGLRSSLPRKESALRLARDAIESEEVGRFSKANLAQVLPGSLGKLFQTAKGAQLVTAGKENLLGNMARASAKAQNQWFEQRLNSMFPQIGQSEEANLTIQEMLDGEVALDKAYMREYDRLSQEDENKYGYIRKGIDKRAREAVEPLEKRILDRQAYRMREIEEREKGPRDPQKTVTKSVTRGTPLTLETAKMFIDKYENPEEAIKVAKKLGYEIPTQEDIVFFKKNLGEI